MDILSRQQQQQQLQLPNSNDMTLNGNYNNLLNGNGTSMMHNGSSNQYNPLLSHLQSSAATEPSTPPWMQPPLGYKHGQGQAFAQAHLSGNARAAAAGRALLDGFSSSQLR
jgi:hypothetical protein